MPSWYMDYWSIYIPLWLNIKLARFFLRLPRVADLHSTLIKYKEFNRQLHPSLSEIYIPLWLNIKLDLIFISLLEVHLHSTLIKYKVKNISKYLIRTMQIYIPLWLNIKISLKAYEVCSKGHLHSTLIKYKGW